MLGAAFSKAISDLMPTLRELAPEVPDSLLHSRVLGGWSYSIIAHKRSVTWIGDPHEQDTP